MKTCAIKWTLFAVLLFGIQNLYAQSLTVGNFHALIIGNNNYKGESGVWHDLKTPGENAETLAGILKEKYRFEEVSLLRNATRKEIIYALEEIPSRVQKNDSVLIYYAGHAKAKGSNVYWIPSDAKGNSTGSYIDTDDVRSLIDNISDSARHILLISDAPFDTSLIDINEEPDLKVSINKKFLPQLSANKSAQAIIMANTSFVDIDYNGSGQTPLSYHLNDILRNTSVDVLTFEELANRIYHELKKSQRNQLKYGVIRGTKDDAGEYMFIKSRSAMLADDTHEEAQPRETKAPVNLRNTHIVLPFAKF
jgi:hypothetical protein